MEEHPTVPVGLAFESQRQVKIFVGLFGAQVAILLGNPLAMDGPILNFPFLIAYFHPSGQIPAIEQRHPVLTRQLGFRILSPSNQRHQEQEHQRERASKHSASRNGFEWFWP
jgi:hypothetical protein